MVTDNTVNVDFDAANELLRGKEATAIVQWATDVFGEYLVMTSSFGAQSAVMLHLCTQVVPRLPVVFIDTGYLFPQTYQFAEQLQQRLNLNLKIYQSPISPARMAAIYGPLWESTNKQDLDRYDRIRKVEPMQHALAELGAKAWLAGLRRSQTDYRAGLRFVESQDGIAKIYPIINWTPKKVHEYLVKHDLPYHPLYEKGYKSIGDWHSTESLGGDDHERAGRFKGLKQECGLHLPQTPEEDQSRDSSSL